MYWLPYSSHTSHHFSQIACLPWISHATQKLMLDSCMIVEKQSEAFHTFLWHLKQNFIAYRSSKMPSRLDCIFKIQQLWQSGFSRVYSNCCCSCSFKPEIIKIDQSFHKVYSNNILNFQESMTILNACTKKVWKLIKCTTYTHTHTHTYIYIYVCVCVCVCVCVYVKPSAWGQFLAEFNRF